MARLSKSNPDTRIRPRLRDLPLSYILAVFADCIPAVMRRITAVVRPRDATDIAHHALRNAKLMPEEAKTESISWKSTFL